jgi:hypothetical protein
MPHRLAARTTDRSQINARNRIGKFGIVGDLIFLSQQFRSLEKATTRLPYSVRLR